LAQARDGEVEGSPLVNGGLGPDSTAVLADDAIDRGEADTGAFELLGAMQALKYAEQFVGIFHVEPDTIVANEDGRIAIVLNAADLDKGDRAWTSIFDGVGEQVGENDFHEAGITGKSWQRQDAPIDLAAFGFAFE